MELHCLSSVDPASPFPAAQRQRIGRALFVSTAAHVLVVAAVVWLTQAPDRRSRAGVHPKAPLPRIVWIAAPGRAGGGGGSPERAAVVQQPTPPQATRTPEPAAPAPLATEEITPIPAAPLELQASALIAELSTAGATVTPATAPGSGAGDGAGSGKGDGIGPGGPRGFGDGAYYPGNGVTSPVPIRRASPAYTVEAMRARAQGVITVECIVEPSGECGDVRIVRGFAPPFGLDQQAIESARRWRFRPGMREGEPVAVRVNLEIEFSIR